MDDQTIRSIQPGDTYRDSQGREWKMPEDGKPYFDQRWGTQGRWVATLLRTDADGTRRMLLLHRSAIVHLERLTRAPA